MLRNDKFNRSLIKCPVTNIDNGIAYRFSVACVHNSEYECAQVVELLGQMFECTYQYRYRRSSEVF